MPWLNCKICDKKFYAKPCHIRRGWGKYCSKDCQYVGQHNGKKVNCGICGKEIYRTTKELRKSKSKKYYCNKSCFAVWKNQNLLLGVKNPHWKNGVNAYRGIMKRSGILAKCAICENNDRRVLVVHHKNRDRKDNKIENLQWLCRNCQHLFHNHNLKSK